MLLEVFVPYRGLFNFNNTENHVNTLNEKVFVPYRGLFNFNPQQNVQNRVTCKEFSSPIGVFLISIMIYIVLICALK